MSRPIPAVWRIDIEPDEFQPEVGALPWQGFGATVSLVESLRARLADLSGHPVHPTWLMRLDPDVERCFGRADYVVHRHADLFDRLRTHGDPLGIHVHPYRWDEQRQVSFSDHADTGWIKHCLQVACESFRDAFGEPVQRSSFGGYFLSEAAADLAVAAGIQVDVTAEPGLEPKSEDAAFGAYATAPTFDYRRCPRRPYFPSVEALDVPAATMATCRPLLLVPLASYDYQTAMTTWPRRIAKTLLGRRRHLPLNPWKWWPNPKTYWDFIERAADESPACYSAFAMRTVTPGSGDDQRVQQLLEYLPNHPIARRLRFVDPMGPEIRSLAIPAPG